MTRARYRLTGFSGADVVALRAVHLLDAYGQRVDVGAVISASWAPASGDLAGLSDAEPAGAVAFERADAPGFFIQFDLSAPADVTALDVVLDDPQTSPSGFTLDAFDGAQWLPVVDTGWLGGHAAGAVLRCPMTVSRPLVLSAAESRPMWSAIAVTDVPGGVRCDGLGEAYFPIVLDVEDVSLDIRLLQDNLGLRHAGVFLFDAVNGRGLRLAFYNDQIYASWFDPNEVAVRAGQSIAPTTGLSSSAVRLHIHRSGAQFAIDVNGVPTMQFTEDRLSGSPLLAAFVYGNVCEFTGAQQEGLHKPPVSTAVVSVQTAHGSPAMPFSLHHVAGQTARDVEFGGVASIVGTVGIKSANGEPDVMTRSRVRLLRQRDGFLARETWSGANGVFAFHHLDARQAFIALAQDASGVYAPVAADRRMPEVLP